MAFRSLRCSFVAALLLATGCGNGSPVIIMTGGDLSMPVNPVEDLARGPDLATVCGPCAAPTPICDVKAKKCVGCLVDGDCPDQAICRAGACVPGCSVAHSNCGDAGSCDLDGGTCHGCLADRDCKDPKAAYCDLPSGRCYPCVPERDKCADGAYCAAVPGGGFMCMLGCRADADCAQMFGANGACCAHVCVDVSSSKDNCGACAASCGNAACCNRRCVDQQADPKNCGGCGMVCVAQNSQALCQAGKCAVGMCLQGFADCDGQPQNGCEVNVGGDRSNCGGCGKACVAANADTLCLGGGCVLGACKPGFRDCNMSYGDGCEVAVSSDPLNCGACGANCANLPNAMAGCVNGGCAIGMCNPGFGDCNQMSGDGCESKLGADPKNCGACGKVCPAPPNVVTSCTNGACATGGCVQGYADCNNNMADGCEVRLADDVKNCGACGMVCAGMGQNAVAACANSACTLKCNAGFGNCDMNNGNGCEKDLNSDAMNCGACGMACMQGACSSGVCAASQSFVNSGTFTVPGNVKGIRVLVVGGGGGGANGHQGGGGSGVVAGASLMVNPGDVIAVTVGAGGLGAVVCNGCNNIVGNTPGGNSSFGGLLMAIGGGTPTVINGPGGSGGSGGGGSCNGGSPGPAGGTNGSNGVACNQPAGNGQGNTFGTALAGILTATMTPGAGGAGGNSSHSAGGGGGGVLMNNMGPSGGDGAKAFSAKGGKGYGAGGGGGGYDGNSGNNREPGGNGAPGIVYVEW